MTYGYSYSRVNEAQQCCLKAVWVGRASGLVSAIASLGGLSAFYWRVPRYQHLSFLFDHSISPASIFQSPIRCKSGCCSSRSWMEEGNKGLLLLFFFPNLLLPSLCLVSKLKSLIQFLEKMNIPSLLCGSKIWRDLTALKHIFNLPPHFSPSPPPRLSAAPVGPRLCLLCWLCPYSISPLCLVSPTSPLLS